MKYGLPYKGSKNKLAERIVRLLPKRTNLVDLFCGGCAVSHAALLMGKYEHVHINDINWMCPTLFINALQGKYNDERRWISRDDFFRLKDSDPYVAVVWSFGNNMRDYLYSREIEPLKRAIHYALFFSDYSLGKELGHDFSFIDPISDPQQRYIAIKHYFSKLGHFQYKDLEKINTNLQNFFLGGGKNDLCRLESMEKVKRPSELQHLERINRVSQLKKKIHRASRAQRTDRQNYLACNTRNGSTVCHDIRGGQNPSITSSVLDYEDVCIPEDSVIYCDIPYEGTNVYNKAEGFDYERFYQWC